MNKQKGMTLVFFLLTVFVVGAFIVGVIVAPGIIQDYKVNKTYETILVLRNSILKSDTTKLSKETPQTLLRSLPADMKKDNKIYISSIDSVVSLSGMSEDYPMSIITIEDMPYELCQPIVRKVYAEFEQVIPYSQKGGIGTCYSWVKSKKPPLETVLNSCSRYENQQKIWLGLLIQNNGNGACNIPD